MLEDWRSAPIGDAEKALFALIEKANRDSTAIDESDMDEAREAGWSDEALYDAVTVCALFNFYNVWIDATGVRDMTPEAYGMSGKRLAERGYTPPGDAPGAETAAAGPATPSAPPT